MRGFLRQHLADRIRRTRMARRQRQVVPVATLVLFLRRVPGMMRVGKTEPEEPVAVRILLLQPFDREIGKPVGVIEFARHDVVRRFRCAGIAAGRGVQQRHHGVEIFRMVRLHPVAVMGDRLTAEAGDVHRLDRVVEAAPCAGIARPLARILAPFSARIESGLEMRLADQRGLVARFVFQILRHARRAFRQRHAVGEDAVGAHILPGEHGRARRHADGVLIVGAGIVDPGPGERVDVRRPAEFVAVAAQRIVTLLVGGDEKYLAAHVSLPAERGSPRRRAGPGFSISSPDRASRRPRAIRRGTSPDI